MHVAALGFVTESLHFLLPHVESPENHPQRLPEPLLVTLHAANEFNVNVTQSIAGTQLVPLNAQLL